MIRCFLVRFSCWKFYPSNLWDGFLGCFWSFFREAIDVANKTPGCSREKSFSVRPGLLRGNRGSTLWMREFLYFCHWKLWWGEEWVVRCPWSMGQTLPGIFALPESLTSLGVTSATLSFNILTSEHVWQIPKSCLLSRHETIVKYSKIFHLQKRKLPSRELTYPPKMAFWRWFSFSRLVGYVNPLEGNLHNHHMRDQIAFLKEVIEFLLHCWLGF